MFPNNSVSTWIAGLKEGDAIAAQRIWNRYSARLIENARARLGNSAKTMADEEDVAQSVFHTVCKGAAAGRFNDLRKRDDLWWLLLAITKQKAVDHIRRENAQKRGGGRVRAESDFIECQQTGTTFSLDQLIGDDPTPEFMLVLDEQNHRLFNLLRDDGLRLIATHRIEGYTVDQIAELLRVSGRTVERKLQLIRKTWAKELDYVD